MTPTELRDWRIKVCTDLANGVQYQMRMNGEEWISYTASAVAAQLFDDTPRYPIRPAPTPRKVWLGWPKDTKKPWNWVVVRGPEKPEQTDYADPFNWQLVEEPLT